MLKFQKISFVILLSICMSAVALAAGNINNMAKGNGDEVLVYPNPVLGNDFNIKTDAEIVEVSVVNVLGQQVYSAKNLQTKRVNIEIDNTDRGLYLVQVKMADGVVITKRILFK